MAFTRRTGATMSTTHQWTDSEGLEFFCRHLVVLCVTYRRKGDDTPVFSAYSGTLIEIQNSILWLTAGHILQDIEAARNSKEIEITEVVLADTFGWKRITHLPIPFDLKRAQLFHVNDDEMGLDFGVMALSSYYLKLLAANGSVALGENQWAHQDGLKFDGYAMLGVPEEFVSPHINEDGQGFVAPTMFGIDRVDASPEESAKTKYPRFLGRLRPGTEIKSVKGMSGGPIFGFILGDQVKYWIVALQSSWNPSSRIVYACPLPTMGSLMTAWAKNHIGEDG